MAVTLLYSLGKPQHTVVKEPVQEHTASMRQPRGEPGILVQSTVWAALETPVMSKVEETGEHSVGYDSTHSSVYTHV